MREARRAAGMTQAELARRVGVAGGERVSVWERGLAAPSAVAVARMAEVLGVDPVALSGSSGEMSPMATLRVQAQLTSSGLAEAMGVTARTISRWESPKTTDVPPERVHDRVAAVLGVSVQRLRAVLEEQHEWRGREALGSRDYESIERDLRIQATHDGHIRLRVRLWESTEPDGWRVEASVHLDAGEALSAFTSDLAGLVPASPRSR